MKKIITAFNKLLVYQKMIVIFAVLLLFFYIVSLMFTNYGKQSIEEQYHESVISKVDFYGELLGEHISFIRTRQLQLFADSDVEKLNFLGGFATTYEEVELVRGIKEELYMINNSSELVTNNGIYLKSYGEVVPINNVSSQYQRIEWDNVIMEVHDNNDTALQFIDDQLYIIASDMSKEIISYIQLSEEQLIHKLAAIIEGKQDAGVFLVDHVTGKIITSPNANQALIDEIMESPGNTDQSTNESAEHEVKTKNIRDNPYEITTSDLPFLNMTLYTYVNSNEMTEQLSALESGFLILTIVSFLLFILFAWLVNQMIHKPLNKLVELFQYHQENIREQINPARIDGEFAYLYYKFNEMTDRLNQSIKENYQQKLELQNSELKQLQSQINPHFLYNSFYNIYRLSKMNNLEQVATLSQKLASYYQFITKSGKDDVPFEQEYRHALDYCTIQKIRFSNRIHFYAPELTEQMQDIAVPRLLIQPIIENAFEHAFEHAELGIINIRVQYDRKELTITIEDNGDQLTDERLEDMQQRLLAPEQELEKTGIFNVCSRLKLKNAANGVFASRSHMGGLKIVMKIHGNG
ncbi:sensor histidine kinase [Gracilibacillus alcaliphilus]|uniref:sensor histidine kinase n=1 Tax=Gracilibacillus alcaliphilus TaxID=1401441 RepID=UPI00195A02F6|nr:histidine kinase [Gracilibacillus alcaliphilus]MBM7679057.1 two-component system sensor histidine kinase YesM [Gracilibacillus alcaliphilus]